MKKTKCSLCRTTKSLQFHHRYPQTKLNRSLYPEHIDRVENIQLLCADCHIGERAGIEHWDEQKFCSVMRIIPRSKTGLEIYKRKFKK